MVIGSQKMVIGSQNLLKNVISNQKNVNLSDPENRKTIWNLEKLSGTGKNDRELGKTIQSHETRSALLQLHQLYRWWGGEGLGMHARVCPFVCLCAHFLCARACRVVLTWLAFIEA